MRALISLLLTAFAAGAAVAGDIPKGPFTQNECVVCHERETPDLVAAWRGRPAREAHETSRLCFVPRGPARGVDEPGP